MSGLGIRSGSCGSLDKQCQNEMLPIQTASRSKPQKMLKEKERLFHWICKFAGRKKVGMLILCLISAGVFFWVLYVGKGEDTREGALVLNLPLNGSLVVRFSESSPAYEEQRGKRSNETSPLRFAMMNEIRVLPPPSYFLGYSLPPGHPCNSFTLPPPPADKKRTGPRPCPVCYLPVEDAIALMPKYPSFSPVVKNLTYISEDPINRETEFGGSDFGGYPTLKQRSDSFDVRESMTVHCGFVKGPRAGRGTGFDLDENDLHDMEQCHGIVVGSAIFDAFDEIQQPKNISKYSEETVCFFMFVDEQTESFLKNRTGSDGIKKVGMWRVVVVHKLPYQDGRRNGKIPKLLMHRLFPNSRFSLWIDGKLELVVDPYQILERFLWRKNATFAISRHYKRFDVFMEAEANKAAGKYDNASIDFQVEFYKKEGLTPYSEAKLPITSDVPEGCVIIREHAPISNLFTCLWFNEVDRFTSRDQISFSTVRDRIKEKTNYTINMFLDCERRNFVVQKYHLADLERLRHRVPPLAIYPPPSLTSVVGELPPPRKRGRDRRSGSRRHRKVALGIRESAPG